MTAQGWHPNPQLMMQPQHPHAPPPQGWAGSWPPGANVAFPPGYPGPPPIPGGAPIAHPRWNAGFWQFNPHVQHQQQQQQQQPWAPGVGWFPPNFNPYKRVPRPPSPSYWKTELSDNGLGLEGMVKRKDPSEYKGEEPHTPWIWNPPSLLESGDRATPARDFNPRRTGTADTSPRDRSSPTREHAQRTAQESASIQTPSQTPDRKSAARGHFYGVHDNAVTPTGPTRHGSDPTDARSSHQSSSQRPLSQTESWPNRSRSQPPAVNEVPPFPAPPPQNPTGRSASVQPPVFTQEPESFTSKVDLHPTFSSSIVRTPTHYQHGRRSTDESGSSHHSRSSSSAGAHPSTSVRGLPAPEPLVRQSSLPVASSTRDVYAGFTEDLSSSLHASTSSSRARPASSTVAGPLARSRTEPVVQHLMTIHESASASTRSSGSGEMFLAPLRDPSSVSASPGSSPDPSPRRRERETAGRRTSPYTSSGPQSPEPSPLYRDRDRERERRASPYAPRPAVDTHSHSPSPSPHRKHVHAHTHSHPHTHSRSHSHAHDASYVPQGRRDNPLPRPPVERPNLEASRPPAQEPSPPRGTYARKVRTGFWNRRGDHLTSSAHVVYAPHDRAYPDDLRDYPDERDGYRDHCGTYAPWREDRPELPASLPSRGRAPARPYESFIAYTYLQ